MPAVWQSYVGLVTSLKPLFPPTLSSYQYFLCSQHSDSGGSVGLQGKDMGGSTVRLFGLAGKGWSEQGQGEMNQHSGDERNDGIGEIHRRARSFPSFLCWTTSNMDVKMLRNPGPVPVCPLKDSRSNSKPPFRLNQSEAWIVDATAFVLLGGCIHHTFTCKHQPYRLRVRSRSGLQPRIPVAVLLCSMYNWGRGVCVLTRRRQQQRSVETKAGWFIAPRRKHKSHLQRRALNTLRPDSIYLL